MVWFWSVGLHHLRKVAHVNSASRRPAHRFWHGPGRVIATQYPSSLFIAFQGRLVKAAPEQCRISTEEEHISTSEVLQKLCKVREDLARTKIAGVYDITGQPHPTVRGRYCSGSFQSRFHRQSRTPHRGTQKTTERSSHRTP